MTINPLENVANFEEEIEPTTPNNDGKVEFLSDDVVKYTSPPRIKQVVRPAVPPPPPYTNHQHQHPPPHHIASPYPMMQQHYPSVPQFQYAQVYPQPHVYSPPQMVYMAPQIVHQPPPQVVQQQATPPQTQNINVCVNSSPGSMQNGGNGALVCPKCRKGIITRKQDKRRKKLLIFLAVFCCPLTCCIPLCCIRSNFVDTCGSCGKKYGHRGKKTDNTKVNAVKI